MTKKIFQTVLVSAVILTGIQMTVNAESRAADRYYWQAMPGSSGAVPDTPGKQHWPETGPGHAGKQNVIYYDSE